MNRGIAYVVRRALPRFDLPVSDNLPDDPETLKAMLLAERHRSERLRQIIKELQRHRFGRKAEPLPEEQMLLGLEDFQKVAACTEASQDETAPEGRPERARKRRSNCEALPAHLRRIEVVVELDDKTCRSGPMPPTTGPWAASIRQASPL
ncbi:Transposase C of IS166 homeodomain-containing protein [Bradyrhizobium shewense]|uniref:Transposase C of IS166 homeodomain-containing protein n=1 Tax=Bradyrhizobium shewense TaxID=1761772 RepID=A0A1C3TYZ1_9BRAD|nr:Transposase C of IS166 homeodomain-containing protein [Bradyrhizobium shewense]